MANTYKDIVITPNKGSTTDDPKITFSGGNTSVNTDITLRVYPTSNGTLSFEGTAGQLFSITNDLTGSIFSVNDVSGIPSIDVNANGLITIAGYSGNLVIGRTNNSTMGQNVKLDIAGSVNARSYFANGVPLTGGATGGGTDDIFYENSQNVNSNYTITTNKNAMSTGPITIKSGVTVTVPSGSRWVVI